MIGIGLDFETQLINTHCKLTGRLQEFDELLEIGLIVGGDANTANDEIAVAVSPTGRTVFKIDEEASKWQVLVPSYLELTTLAQRVSITETDDGNVAVIDIKEANGRYIVLKADSWLFVVDRSNMSVQTLTVEEYDELLNQVTEDDRANMPIPTWSKFTQGYKWGEGDFIPLVEPSPIFINETDDTDTAAAQNN